jgi:hypothetical protein
MKFKEFLSQEQPSKANGTIDHKGNISYAKGQDWISFHRVNLDGSYKNSFWIVSVPTMKSQRVQEALRIWALNMPEHYSDDVIINSGKTTVKNLADFDFTLEKISCNDL